MFNPFKAKKILLFSLILLFVFSLPAAAKIADWKNPAYNFEQVKTILVEKPVFFYDYPERGTSTDKNYFEKYPHSENVIMSILSKQISKLPKYSFIHEAPKNIAATGAQPGQPPQTNASQEVKTLPDNAPEPIGDLILSIKITDFGWYYSYHEGYWTTESIPKEETIYERDSSGKLREVGKKKSTTIVPVYRPPGYRIKDVASAELTLIDAKTGEEVWKHTDYRDRDSSKSSWEKDGPESMMNRIFSNAFEKMPFVKK